MKLSEQQAIFSRNVAKLIDYINYEGYSCTLSEAYRPAETAKLYEEKGIGVANSLHCMRLAIDLNIFSPEGEYLNHTEDYELFGKFWKRLYPKNNWGGDFKRKDGNHFEQEKQ